jgi:hypothetical protein
MEFSNRSPAAERSSPELAARSVPPVPQGSAVSWSAIIAGGAAAAALSLILLVLGTGLGMSALSPWAAKGMSGASLGVATILWLTFTQLAASGVGGYLAGRLRSQWLGLEHDEIYFRDTAHGFLAWGVATLATAALLGSAIGSLANAGIEAGASVAGGAATTATAGVIAGGSAMAASERGDLPIAYEVDSLFRKSGMTAPAGAAGGAANTPGGTDGGTGNPGNMPGNGASGGDRGALATREAGRIFMNSLRGGPLPPEDQRYLAQLVAERTGLPQQDAEKRVSDVYARAQARLRDAESALKSAADQARKATAYTALWLFISLLIGAFVASLAATYGGRQREFPARAFR